jgi:hypothetical protein
MVGLVPTSDHCSICETVGVEADLLICDTCGEYVCEDCREDASDGVFCSEECLLRG